MARVRHEFSTGISSQDVSTNILHLEDGVTAPAAIAGVAQIFIDTSGGDLKIIFADGTTKTIVVDT